MEVGDIFYRFEGCSVEDFESWFARWKGVTVDSLHEAGRWGHECDCGDGSCYGYQMTRMEPVYSKEPSDER